MAYLRSQKTIFYTVHHAANTDGVKTPEGGVGGNEECVENLISGTQTEQ